MPTQSGYDRTMYPKKKGQGGTIYNYENVDVPLLTASGITVDVTLPQITISAPLVCEEIFNGSASGIFRATPGYCPTPGSLSLEISVDGGNNWVLYDPFTSDWVITDPCGKIGNYLYLVRGVNEFGTGPAVETYVEITDNGGACNPP